MTRGFLAVATAATLLGGCSTIESTWDSVFGGDEEAAAPAPADADADTAAAEPSDAPAVSVAVGGRPPALGTTNFAPEEIAGSGEAAELARTVRAQNQALQLARVQFQTAANRYANLAAGRGAQGQPGTGTVDAAAAQAQLVQLESAIGRAQTLQGEVERSEASARQLALASSDAATARLAQLADRMAAELREDVRLGTDYVSAERAAWSQMGGMAPAVPSDTTVTDTAPLAPAPTGPASSGSARPMTVAVGRPLVVIRFDRPDVAYETELRTVVTEAMQRRPDIAFDLVAVSPGYGSRQDVARNTAAAQANAAMVMRSLTGMGLSPDKVAVTAMTSTAVQGNEVQLYPR